MSRGEMFCVLASPCVQVVLLRAEKYKTSQKVIAEISKLRDVCYDSPSSERVNHAWQFI